MKTEDTSNASYSIGELAERGGVNRRTVRYYVQRGLLPAPEGTGRGSRYLAHHLETLIRIRELQEAGVPLAKIADGLNAAAEEKFLRSPESVSPLESVSPPESASPATVTTWTRIVLGDGAELHLRNRWPTKAQVDALREAIQKIINEGEYP